MTSKERIYKILNFQIPDRIGIHDIFLNSTIEDWKTNGLPNDTSPGDYFSFDFEIFDMKKILSNEPSHIPDTKKFTILSFSEPFQKLCDIFGRENTLRELARRPQRFNEKLIQITDYILNSFQEINQKGLRFDGAWAWGDLAYSKGPFISFSDYERHLFPLHKKIFQYLDSQGYHIFFHSDGNISDLIPYLLDAGVRAFHPLELGDADIHKLIKRFKDKMVFMGCIDIEKMIQDGPSLKKLVELIDRLKKSCSYIYHANYPISPNISFKDYSLLVETVKKCGAHAESN